MSSSPNGTILNTNQVDTTNTMDTPSNRITAFSRTIPPNLRPQQDIPAYTLPIPPKPETEEQKIIYEKEILLSIVATPEESWEERDARVRARRKSLEVVAIARWGVRLRDLDMLAAEKERWKEYDEARARGEDPE
jgi:hypothetical protein